MAITIVTEPQALQPAYNDTFILVDSTNVTLPSYRYIAELYINNVKLVAFKIVPEFGSGYGRLNMTKLVSGYLTNALRNVNTQDFVDGLISFLNGLNLSYVNVKVSWGEEYQPDPWEFDDYLWAGSTSWFNFIDPSINLLGISQTMLIGSDEPDYGVGDIITVNQNAEPGDSEYRVELQGNHLILDIFTSGGDWYVVLDLPWIGSGAASSGSTTYADNRKVINLDELVTDDYVFFNGAEKFEKYKDWDADEYTLTSGTSKFLTTLPRSKPWRVREDSLVFIQGRQVVENTMRFVVNNVVTDSYVINQTGVNLYDVSPRQLTAVSDYEVLLDDFGAFSERLKFKVDQNCYGFADCEIVFMDRFGSFLPIQFQLRRSQNIDVNREQYKKDITTDEMYVYNTYDGGSEDLFIDVGKRYTLRSDRMTTDEAIMMEELVSSPFTIVRFGTDDYVRCKVLTRNLEIKDEYFEGIRYYDIDIEITNKDVVNW